MELNDGLYSAIQKGDAKQVNRWLDRGAAINAILNDNKWRPLHIATFMNRIDVLELLLKRKADVNLVDADGNSALHLAASNGSLPATVILVEHGSNLEARNIKYNTAYDEAKNRQTKSNRIGRYNFEVFFEDEHITDKNTGNYNYTTTELVEYLKNVTDNPQYSYKVLTQREEKLQATKDLSKIEKDIQLPWLVDAIEFQHMLSHGEYLSYENRLSLGGPCRAGKSTLASVLIGEKVPLKWNSTDGLVIFFGRNGIDIERNKMVPLKKGDRGHEVLAKILRGKPEEFSEQFIRPETTTSHERVNTVVQTAIETSKQTENIKEKHKTTSHSTDKYATKTRSATAKSFLEQLEPQISDTYIPSTAHKIQTFDCQKLQLQSDILQEVRNGQYKIEIAPSDLIDFGGQKSYDMTHQLFIQHQGSILLMFDGRFGLHKQLDDHPKGVTAASILIHWVDSILTYTDNSEDIMPMILFAATHRDKCKEDTTKMTESFIGDIRQLFSKHEKRQHIHLDTVYFINGTDKNDVEIQHMTDQVVMFAKQQSSWGQRRPMQWVPLQLQIANMRMKNINIITKKDLLNVNELNDDLALTEGQLDDFLLVQHSLGKLMYYNRNGLDNFIIIHPPALVNILRSFVTDKKFFPGKKDLKSILQTLTVTGKIYKTDLLKLWQQNHLHEYMPDSSIKEFVIELLIHLDVLIIPKANTQNSVVHDVYLVPCMIKPSKPFGFNSFESQIQTTICLRYSLSLHSIPSALAYKVLGAALNAWPLKDKNRTPCLYHKAAVLNVNEANEIRICLEDNSFFISLTNQQSLLEISPDIAASIQECLTKNLQSSLLFYYNSFGRKMKQGNVAELYSMEVGIPCGRHICFISLQESMTNDKWICNNGKVHETRYLRYWVFNKSKKICGHECTGLNANELKTEPSDKHLVRLGCQLGIQSFEDFFITLGMEKNDWENIEYMYAAYSPEGIMSMALNKWKVSKPSQLETPSLKDLSDALIAVNLDDHLICQVFRENTQMFEIADFHLQNIPSDNDLKELSNHIGNCPLQLGIELGLRFTDVQQSLFKFPKDLPGLLENILWKWKKQSKVKTIHSLVMALERVRGGGVRYLRDLYKLP